MIFVNIKISCSVFASENVRRIEFENYTQWSPFSVSIVVTLQESYYKNSSTSSLVFDLKSIFLPTIHLASWAYFTPLSLPSLPSTTIATSRSASRIRAVWLGWRARCLLAVRKRAVVMQRQEAFFHQAATAIQKWYDEQFYTKHKT
jgi:hypothetical protein